MKDLSVGFLCLVCRRECSELMLQGFGKEIEWERVEEYRHAPCVGLYRIRCSTGVSSLPKSPRRPVIPRGPQLGPGPISEFVHGSDRWYQFAQVSSASRFPSVAGTVKTHPHPCHCGIRLCG